MGNRYLIDTHILLWWVFDDPKLDNLSRGIIQNPNHQILVSSASAWEIATKYRIGKLPEAKELIENYAQTLKKARFFHLGLKWFRFYCFGLGLGIIFKLIIIIYH